MFADRILQICAEHFPQANLKCFQILPIDANGQIVKQFFQTIEKRQCLISIQNISQIDHSNLENWTMIKMLFQTDSASCMWFPSDYDGKADYKVIEHMEAYRTKLKYEIMINLRDKLENYQRLVTEVAWHKMIYWFQNGNAGTLDRFLNECLAELTRMKKEQVVKRVNLYEFVMKDKEGTEKIALHRLDSHKEYLTKYEIYADFIECALEMAYRRSELIKEIEETGMKTSLNGKDVALDYGSVRHLASYLNDSDIKNLIDLFRQ